MRRRILILIAIALSGALGGCGFQLRGNYALPFDTLYLALPDTSELHAVIKRNLEALTQARVVADAKQAQATLVVTGDSQVKNVLSLSAAGRVSEYQLVRTFGFRVSDAADRELIPASQIVVRRDISFSDAQVLSKEAEETALWRDMQNDLVQQLLRRLSTAKRQT